MFVDWRNLPAMTDAVQMAGWVWRGVVVWDKGISRNQPERLRVRGLVLQRRPAY